MNLVYPDTSLPFRDLSKVTGDEYSYYTLRQMTVFSYLVATGDIAETARKNAMSPQSVINNCNKLSKTLGHKVIERKQGAIYITPFGKGFADQFIPLLREFQGALGSDLMPKL